ncbi:MAG: endonuclease/exonuclease/phosphatase family protein [Verrucomicrobia bacterium]|nr:endonuclease/exonuclease/phosphatase family protein [Verrucomicrobiota bacterium]
MNPFTRRRLLQGFAAAAALPTLARVVPAATPAPPPGGRKHTVLTCNIRVALPEDDASGNGWKARRQLCMDVIRAQQPDLVGLQEVLREQMEDLERGLPEFGSFGFAGPEMDARRDGYHGIAKNPLLYSRKRYDFVSAGGFWLSETPHLPGSLSWESARARHVNWLRLRERATGREFRFLNTHLDHQGQRAREEQMKLILAEAAVYAPEFPQIFTGDFNARASNPVVKLALDAGWTSTYFAAPEPRDEGFTGHAFLGPAYQPKSAASGPKAIDHILTRGPVTTQSWRIIRDSREGRYPSDHYFVAAEVIL